MPLPQPSSVALGRRGEGEILEGGGQPEVREGGGPLIPHVVALRAPPPGRMGGWGGLVCPPPENNLFVTVTQCPVRGRPHGCPGGGPDHGDHMGIALRWTKRTIPQREQPCLRNQGKRMYRRPNETGERPERLVQGGGGTGTLGDHQRGG